MKHPSNNPNGKGDSHKIGPELNQDQPKQVKYDAFMQPSIPTQFLDHEEGASKLNYLKSIQMPIQNNNDVIVFDLNNNTNNNIGFQGPGVEIDSLNHENEECPYNNEDPTFNLSRNSPLHIIVWDNRHIRQQFLRRILTVISMQLLVVICWTLICFNVQKLGNFIQTHYWYAGIAIVIYLSLYFLVVFGPKICKRFPFDFLILTFYTITLAYLCSYVSLQYTTNIVILGMSATILLCIALILITKFTPLDVTGWAIYLTLAGSFVMLFAISIVICSFLLDERNEAMNILHITGAFLGAGIVSAYFLYDVQMIIGGRRSEISPDEWLYASMTIFYDIVLFFVYVVSIFGLKCTAKQRQHARAGARAPRQQQPQPQAQRPPTPTGVGVGGAAGTADLGVGGGPLAAASAHIQP